jgi:AAA domain
VRAGEKPLSVVQVARVPRSEGPRWLVEGLWTEEGVGIVGGSPKCCKTWLALDLALSVASGTPALGTYPVPRAGCVLLFAAEDAPAAVRDRLEGLAQWRGLDLAALPLHLVLASALRLEKEPDQSRLAGAVQRYRPRLLVLDPFVRLHRIDENSALEVSGVLAYLRELQREHKVAILVVHHARKARTGASNVGLSLRGSGDFHAWTDDLLHVRRKGEDLELVTEHRMAPSPPPILLGLRQGEGDPPHLEILEAKDPEVLSLRRQVVEVLDARPQATTQEELRKLLCVRMQRLVVVMRELENEGQIRRGTSGWVTAKKG